MSGRPTLSIRRRTLLAATAGLVGVAGCASGDGTDEESADTGAQSPTGGGTEGLQLWLHPDSGTVTADGAVETWRDDSGNGYDFSQPDGERRPSAVDDAVNGHAALRFDGEDDHFVREDALDVSDDSARTFVVVSRLSDPEARSPFLMQGSFDTEGSDSNYYGLEANTFNTAGERFGLYLTSVGMDADRTTDTSYNVHVLRTATFPELSDMEESTTYFVNGEETTLEPTPENARNSPFESDATAIGAFPVSSPEAVLHGDIAEVRVYDRALDDAERSALEDRLLEKYGIAEA